MAEWKRGIHTGMDPRAADQTVLSSMAVSFTLSFLDLFLSPGSQSVSPRSLEGELESVVISQLIKIPLI